MKILEDTKFKIEVSLEELVAIRKLIGYTSSNFRTTEVGMTEEESLSLAKMFDTLCNRFGPNW